MVKEVLQTQCQGHNYRGCSRCGCTWARGVSGPVAGPKDIHTYFSGPPICKYSDRSCLACPPSLLVQRQIFSDMLMFKYALFSFLWQCQMEYIHLKGQTYLSHGCYYLWGKSSNL